MTDSFTDVLNSPISTAIPGFSDGLSPQTPGGYPVFTHLSLSVSKDNYKSLLQAPEVVWLNTIVYKDLLPSANGVELSKI